MQPEQFKIPSELLIATNNRGKFIEIESLLKEISIAAIPSFQFNLEEPEETGLTFAENSLLKAKFYSLKTGLTSLADDSGLCIEELGNAPGIHSARFAIDDKTGEKNFPLAFEKIFFELKEKGFDLKSETLHKSTDKPTDKARAHFICSLALFNPKTNFSISFEGRVDGTISSQPLGNKGFGYDPIFIKNGMSQTFGEIESSLKDAISHRAEAFKKFSSWIQTWIKNGGL